MLGVCAGVFPSSSKVLKISSLISWNGSSTKVALVLRKLISLIAPINLDFRGHDKYQSKGIFCLLDTLTWETHCT